MNNNIKFLMILITATLIGTNQIWDNTFTKILMIASIVATLLVLLRRR